MSKVLEKYDFASKKVKTNTVLETAARHELRTNGRGIGDERVLTQLEKTIDTAKGMSMLIYDIPTVLNEECPNPSVLLWNYGFRLEKSCWVLPEKSLNSSVVQRLLEFWAEKNVATHIIPYAESAIEQIKSIARQKLYEEMVRISASLIAKVANASDRLHTAIAELNASAASTALDYEREQNARISAQRTAIHMAGKSLNSAINCAKAFDETESVKDLIAGIRAAIQAEREALRVLLENRVRS